MVSVHVDDDGDGDWADAWNDLENAWGVPDGEFDEE
jgi:hypothetical protein